MPMSRSLIILGVILMASFGHRAALAEGPGLHAVAVELPGSDRELPAGPGAELVTNNCTACHSPGMILTQPALTKATWLAEVNKMRSTYKAPIADENVEPIVTYLASMHVGP